MVNNQVSTVLISSYPVPYKGIGSWTNMLNFLVKDKNELDYIICPKSETSLLTTKQVFINKNTFLDRFNNKFDKVSRFNRYLRKIDFILDKEEKIVLQVIDNLGLLKAIIKHIKLKNISNKIYLQYYYHSFPAFTKDEDILNSIDELILISSKSYQDHKNTLSSMPFEVNIINNGVDSKSFKKLSSQEKIKLRETYNINKDEIVFTWCSQDKKKKGLELMLKIWGKLQFFYKDKIKLYVVGTTKKLDVPNVYNVGRVTHNKLAEYYQIADFYIYPTLCQEGFGLSLAEALKSGCYCIASDNGAVSDVLLNGKLGLLVEQPNLINNWVEIITNCIDKKIYEEKNFYNKEINSLYNIEDWKLNYNTLLLESRKKINKKLY